MRSDRSAQRYLEKSTRISSERTPRAYEAKELECLVREGAPRLMARLTSLGRVSAVRSGGSKLLFINLTTDGTLRQDADHVQVVCSYSEIHGAGDTAREEFDRFRREIGKGDWLCMRPRDSTRGRDDADGTRQPSLVFRS